MGHGRRFAAVLAGSSIVCGLAPALAQELPPPEKARSSLSPYEQAVMGDALKELRSEIDPSPEGKTIESIEVLPREVGAALRVGVNSFERTMRGFMTEEAQLVGVETRTSAPVRISRDEVRLESPSHPGLYPCGEGAGFAGGIVSAAIDGMRVAEAVLKSGISR